MPSAKANRRITRLYNSVGHVRGYWVRFETPQKAKQRGLPQRSFTKVAHGSLRAALRAAQLWRDQIEIKHGLKQEGFRGGPRKTWKDKKEFIGVSLYIAWSEKRNGLIAAWRAGGCRPGKMRQKNRVFSLVKYGYQGAYLRAVAMRCQLTGEPWPVQLFLPSVTAGQQSDLKAVGVCAPRIRKALMISEEEQQALILQTNARVR